MFNISAKITYMSRNVPFPESDYIIVNCTVTIIVLYLLQCNSTELRILHLNTGHIHGH